MHMWAHTNTACSGRPMRGRQPGTPEDVSMNQLARLAICGVLCAVPLTAHGQGSYAGQPHTCRVTISVTEFKSPERVWWGHMDRSFGNYLAFERAAIPEATPETPAVEFPPILFDLDKSDIRPDAMPILAKVIHYLQANPGKQVKVAGHCCDLASNEYNMALGQRRADSVKAYLVPHGIDAGRIATVSYGEERLAFPPGPQRHLNRRAVIHVTRQGAASAGTPVSEAPSVRGAEPAVHDASAQAIAREPVPDAQASSEEPALNPEASSSQAAAEEPAPAQDAGLPRLNLLEPSILPGGEG
jgi:outer membrane protein OmpA-like peptidoglycan-associated protein